MIRQIIKTYSLVIISVFVILIVYFIFFKLNKLVRKELSDENIGIKWYYYSYITNTSPDFIQVKYNGESIIIYEAEDVVTDISVNKKTIKINLFEPERGIVYTENLPADVFGYKLLLDSTATYMDYQNTPHGKKESLYEKFIGMF